MASRKTTSTHRAEVEALGYQLLSEYKGNLIKCIYYCPKHDQSIPLTPKQFIRAKKLSCCNGGPQKTTAEHAKEVSDIGKVTLVGEYLGATTETSYRCNTHGRTYNALPTNILAGKGLKCCKRQGAQDQANKKKAKAAAEYDTKLAKIGKLKRISHSLYGGGKVPILHRCLLHGGLGIQSPNQAVSGKGKGLKCCLEASWKEGGDARRFSQEQFLEELAKRNPNIEYISGEYINQQSKIKCRCKKHDHTQDGVWAMQVLAGSGLECCGIENSREVGRNSLNGASIDNVWRALLDRLERGGFAYIYLYESPVITHNKYGISNNPPNRAKIGGYGKQLIEPRFFSERRDAVLVEQAFKYGYGSEVPEELTEWTGREELTNMHPEEFVPVIEELEMALNDMGRWSFAQEYCDPAEIRRAKKEMEKDRK